MQVQLIMQHVFSFIKDSRHFKYFLAVTTAFLYDQATTTPSDISDLQTNLIIVFSIVAVILLVTLVGALYKVSK